MAKSLYQFVPLHTLNIFFGTRQTILNGGYINILYMNAFLNYVIGWSCVIHIKGPFDRDTDYHKVR